MVTKKKVQKHFGAIVGFNAGRDKKTGKIVQFSQPIATTADSKEDAKREITKQLNRIKEGKSVSKTFAVNPRRIKNKADFIKSSNRR